MQVAFFLRGESNILTFYNVFFKCVPFYRRLPSDRRSVHKSNEAITCTLHTHAHTLALSMHLVCDYLHVVFNVETTAVYTLFFRAVPRVPVHTAAGIVAPVHSPSISTRPIKTSVQTSRSSASAAFQTPVHTESHSRLLQLFTQKRKHIDT